MNPKKLALTVTAITVALVLKVVSRTSFKVETSNTETSKSINLPKNTVSANRILFERIEDVEQDADLIVVGKTTTEFEETQPLITRFPNGDIENFFTITPF